MASSGLRRMLRRAFFFLYVDVETAKRETKRLTKRFTDPKLLLITQTAKYRSIDWSRGGIFVQAREKPKMGARLEGRLETMTGKRIGDVSGKVVKVTPKGFALDFDSLSMDTQNAMDATIREQVKA